ncbi:MAG: ATP-dependent DNA helicase [Betaproteobacteria bacterium]|nr:ATP-dependent DNA helicase [Betaproteobacteria bacterium]
MTERLSDVVREMFTPHGPLARATAFFQPRQGQTDMALAVADTLEKGGSLVVEAGTGVGKTFAYLVPALLSGERVLLSTATKTLQDQLFSRDIPDVIKALGLPLKLAMLKGRGSYLCQQRLELALSSASLPDRHAVKTLAVVQQWAKSTVSGDLAEVPSLDEQSALIPLITSNRDNCLGSPCPHWRECHVNQARREAMAADVVVINHHLFFADMAVRESGMAELLPTVRVVIFDEAHQLNETGIQFLGKQLGSGQLLDLARDTLTAGLQLARGLVDWQTLTGAFEKAVRDWRLLVGKQPANAKLRWSQAQPQGIDPQDWRQALDEVSRAASALQDALDVVMDAAPDFQRLHERLGDVLGLIDYFASPCAVGSVRWLDVSSQMRCMEAPLDIADVVQTKLLDAQVITVPDAEQQPVALPRSWIFTSATLGSDPQLRWFTEPCGLQNAQVLQVQSPFDYENQAWLYVPRGMVSPKDPQHSEQVASLSWQVACTLGGRTLVLTTTTRALRAIGDQLLASANDNPDMDILVQGQHPKRELMQRFRQAIEPGGKGTVLVATASFWEGFDVPGDALQAVIIDKLPFPPPNDPLVEARSQRLEAQGRSSFNDYFLPEAGVSLKQGAGRLIRRETDRGALVICDNRLVSTPYGRRLLAVLPPMKRVDQFPALLAALSSITKT